MTRSIYLSIALLLAQTTATNAATAFVNVNVVPMTSETVLAQKTVLVEDGIIVLIGDVDGIPIPEDVEVIDGTDRYLIPGLAEMHAHLPGAGTRDIERTLTLFAANGITRVRGMLGQPSHLRLRQQLLDGEVFGPRLTTSGPSFSGNSVSGAEDAIRRVRSQHADGYDFIKLHPGLSADEFQAIADTANELGMPFPGAKGTLYDSGVGTPMIFRWPGKEVVARSLGKGKRVRKTINYADNSAVLVAETPEE